MRVPLVCVTCRITVRLREWGALMGGEGRGRGSGRGRGRGRGRERGRGRSRDLGDGVGVRARERSNYLGKAAFKTRTLFVW